MDADSLARKTEKSWRISLQEKAYRLVATLKFWKSKTDRDDRELFSSLSPTTDADQDQSYSKALKWALTEGTRKGVKNIAITGPFGSGKSSILQTFQKKCKDIGASFLNISLATFKEEIDENGRNRPAGTELLRQIEISILQQIFYHEKPKAIPDSRLRRITSHSSVKVLTVSIATLLFISSIVYLFDPSIPQKYLWVVLSPKSILVLHALSVVVSFSGALLLLAKVYRTLTRIRLSKISIQKNEFEIGEDIAKSILNTHINEIIYFFEVTKYNVVIIEDLDRFQQTEIFTKLREINLLINNSKNVKKHVVFIYAVRDEMFLGKDRTKFFDFIVPVIPVINFSNSKEILIAKSRKAEYKIDEHLIEDISLFLDDMRLLHNIVNEFQIYMNKLSPKLVRDKLFALICYKNIHPEDFTKLGSNSGDLYLSLAQKKVYIQAASGSIDEAILKYESELKRIESQNHLRKNDLRMVYLFKTIERIPNFLSFFANGTPVSLAQMVEPQYFSILATDNISYQHQNPGTPYVQLTTSRVPFTFESTVALVDNSFTYEERNKILEDMANGQNELVRSTIAQLRLKKRGLATIRLKDLIRNETIKITTDDTLKIPLIALLLRSGYIDEDYLDYISVFYEGTIAKTDHQFLMNVKTGSRTDFGHKLQNVKALVSRIDLYEFERPFVLNFDIVQFVVDNDSFTEHRSLIFTQLSNESEVSIEFVLAFFENSTDVSRFIRILATHWKGIWSFLTQRSSFTELVIREFFVQIATTVPATEILKLTNVSSFRSYFETLEDLSPFALNLQKFSLDLFEIEIRFRALSQKVVPTELKSIIYETNSFAIEVDNIKYIVDNFSSTIGDDFQVGTLSYVASSGCESLLEYIENSFDQYLKNVYSTFHSQTKESSSVLMRFLNETKFSIESKEYILERTTYFVADVDEVHDLSVLTSLLKLNKIEANWLNCFKTFNKFDCVIPAEMVALLNSNVFLDRLCQTRLSESSVPKDEVSSFLGAMLFAGEIEVAQYSKLTRFLGYTYNKFDIQRLESAKAASLVENRVFVMSIDNFNALKTAHPDLLPRFVRTNISKFAEDINSLGVDATFVSLLIGSKLFDSDELSTITSGMDQAMLVADAGLVATLMEIAAKTSTFAVSKAVIVSGIGSPTLSVSQKVSVMSSRLNLFDRSEITDLLTKLGRPYSPLTDVGKRPTLVNSRLNLAFVTSLRENGYVSNFSVTEKEIRVITFRK